MTVMLQTDAVAKEFILHLRGGVRIPVLSNVQLTVHAGECVALHGPSGAGKSTLMRTIYANYRATSGRILVHHDGAMIDVVAADARTILEVRLRSLGYVSQFLRVVPRVAAADIVAEPIVARAGPNPAREARALLRRFNLPDRLHDLPPATFSGGEQQRVNLARGFAGQHPILLLDEPTASLDNANRDIVIDVIKTAKANGTAILAIFHDLAAVRDALADRLFEMA